MDDPSEKFQRRLFELQDLKYREFQCKLMPSVDSHLIIGVRTPALRKLAGELSGLPEAAQFLTVLPHTYFEENNLHGFLMEAIRDYDACIAAVEAFLPYVDNWETCDLMSPKIFKKHLPELYGSIKRWLKSDRTYTVRFGIEMLMRFYLDDNFQPEMLERVADLRSGEYYVNMMIAWYFATALSKQYDAALPYLEKHRLEDWTHNKAIQKAIESRRIRNEAKRYLRTLKIKK